MTALPASVAAVLPEDAEDALLIGRLWDSETAGPRVVAVRGGDVFDLQHLAGTVSELLERPDLAADVRSAMSAPRWKTADVVGASLAQDTSSPHLLAPVDLQVIKACGVTFVDSMIERVIEERCGGDAGRATEMRELVGRALGGSIGAVRPGSPRGRRCQEGAHRRRALVAVP